MKFQNRPTRREFIKQSLSTTAMLALATGCRRLSVRSTVAIDPAAIKKFGASLKGRLVLPADPDYEKTRRVLFWNPRTERRPVVIAKCAHADDIVRAVEFGRRHGLETAVRAGGHSFLGWGTSNGLIIDLSGMKGIVIDPVRRVGRVGLASRARPLRCRDTG